MDREYGLARHSRISLRVTDEEKQAIEDGAAFKGVGISDWIRQAIQEALLKELDAPTKDVYPPPPSPPLLTEEVNQKIDEIKASPPTPTPEGPGSCYRCESRTFNQTDGRWACKRCLRQLAEEEQRAKESG